jgi:hypothetical protein
MVSSLEDMKEGAYEKAYTFDFLGEGVAVKTYGLRNP